MSLAGARAQVLDFLGMPLDIEPMSIRAALPLEERDCFPRSSRAGAVGSPGLKVALIWSSIVAGIRSWGWFP
jgi:hypothetical protein